MNLILHPLLLPQPLHLSSQIHPTSPVGCSCRNWKQHAQKRIHFLPPVTLAFTKPAPLCSAPINSIHIHSTSKARNHWVVLRHLIPSPSTRQSSNPRSLTSETTISPSSCLSIHNDWCSHSFSAGPLQHLLSVLHVSLGYLLKKQSNQDMLLLRNPCWWSIACRIETEFLDGGTEQTPFTIWSQALCPASLPHVVIQNFLPQHVNVFHSCGLLQKLLPISGMYFFPSLIGKLSLILWPNSHFTISVRSPLIPSRQNYLLCLDHPPYLCISP